MEFHEFKSAILQLLTRNEYTIENDDVGYNQTNINREISQERLQHKQNQLMVSQNETKSKNSPMFSMQ